MEPRMDAGSSSTTNQWLTNMKLEARGIYLARLLPICARVTEDGDIMNAGSGLKNIAELVSPDGDALQRVATYVNEGLAYRMVKNFRGVPEALRLTNRLSASEQVLVWRLFRELCPFLMFSYIITNHAIAEAMESESMLHVIDLNACDPQQWILLLHTLKQQRQANNLPLPFLKITGIHEKSEVLDEMEFRLSEVAEKLNFPFHFYKTESRLEDLDFQKLQVKPGEPFAISSVLQLHSLLATDDQMVAASRINSPAASGTSMDQRIFAELLGKCGIKPSPDSALSPPSQCASPRMECFLNDLWKLQPRLVVITEQELNAKGSTLMDRFEETLNFYCALFDCLEANVSKARAADRIILERMLFGEEIKNIVACEGVERKERHEKAKTWVRWLELAGFRRVPISYERMLQATRPLQSYGHGYKLLEHNQCLFTCWKDRPLYSISAWRF